MITRYHLLPGGHYAPYWADAAFESGHEERDADMRICTGMWLCADIPEQFFEGLPARIPGRVATYIPPITLVLSSTPPRGSDHYEVRALKIDGQPHLEVLDLAEGEGMIRLTSWGTELTNYVFVGRELYRAVRAHATRRAVGSRGARVAEPSGRAFLWIELS